MDTTPPTERELLAAFSGGDPAAFAELARRTGGMVHATCRRVLGDPQLAHDAAQETFLQLLRDHRTIDGSVPAWLHRVATSKAIDLARREGRLHRREERAAGPREARAWDDVAGLVDEALESLAPEQRALLVRCHLEGAGQAAVAAELACSQATVSRRLSEAEEALRARLRQLGVAAGIALLVSGFAADAAAEPPPALVAATARMPLAPAAAGAAPAWLIAVALLAVVIGGVAVAVVIRGGDAPPTAPPAPAAAEPFRDAGEAPMPTPEDPATVDQALLRRAIDAIYAGDLATLQRLLREHPALARARVDSAVAPYDGYFHGATLLHHVAGNPNPATYPGNAVALAQALLAAGAEVDARTTRGPSQPTDPGWTTLGLAASCDEKVIGAQRGPLIDLLIAAGADVDADNGVPMGGALSYQSAGPGVAALLRHHPKLDLRFAAGVGDLERVKSFFTADGALKPGASFLSRYPDPEPAPGDAGVLAEALDFAATGGADPGRLACARFLLEHGARPVLVREGHTPLHQAAWVDDLAMIRLLLEHGADPTVQDARFHSTPAGWAAHFHHDEAAALLGGK